jgi:hypothetical protein
METGDDDMCMNTMAADGAPPADALLGDGFYVAWRIVSERMCEDGDEGICVAWNLACACKTLRTWIRGIVPARAGRELAAVHSRVRGSCVLCHAPGCTRAHTLHPLHPAVCRGCHDSAPEFEMISANRASREMHVRYSDVMRLERFVTVGGSRGYRMYMLSDVVGLPKKRLVNRRPPSEMVELRREKARDALAKVGLGSDESGYLIRRYIEGRGGVSLNDVVRRTCEDRVLRIYWDWDWYVDRAVIIEREVRGRHCTGEEVHYEAEMLALGDHGGRYPDVWPWLEGKEPHAKK